MHSMLAILICIGIVVEINGGLLKRPASINQDVAEITKSFEKLWSRKPNIMKRVEPLVYCEIMDKCCEEKDRTEAVASMGIYTIHNRDRFMQIMQTCMNSSTANKEGQDACSSIIKSMVSRETIFQDSNVRKYVTIIEPHSASLNDFTDRISLTCNGEELHAFICLSNQKLMQKCVDKVLRKIYNDDYKNYQNIIGNTKQAMDAVNQQLSKEFIKE